MFIRVRRKKKEESRFEMRIFISQLLEKKKKNFKIMYIKDFGHQRRPNYFIV